MHPKLVEISKLKKHWDGYNADPIPSDVISATQKVIDILPESWLATASIVPAYNSVQIEWHKNRHSLELGIIDGRTINWMQWNNDERNGMEGHMSVDYTKGILNLVEWIHGV